VLQEIARGRGFDQQQLASLSAVHATSITDRTTTSKGLEANVIKAGAPVMAERKGTKTR
jgi:hypothetical protein